MKSVSRTAAFLGIMLAVMIILSSLEYLFPPLPFLPGHVKPGLANIITMYCVLCAGRTKAVSLNAAKSFFVLLIRGPVAGLLSFCGGMLSIAVIITLVTLFDRNDKKISYLALSIAGAVSHNLGQYAAVSLLLALPYMSAYIPALIISGIAMGSLTGTLLRTVIPALKTILNSKDEVR